MRYNTEEEARKSQNSEYIGSVPSEEFIPVEITEWIKIGEEKIPHKAIAQDGEEVEYIRNAEGRLLDVGIRVSEEENLGVVSYFEKVDEVKHLTPIEREVVDNEKEAWLNRCWDKMTKEEQDSSMLIDQELHDLETLSREEYILKYPE